MLERLFHLSERRTDVRTEIMAGLTTFMTMAYILAVNPSILSQTGMDPNAVFFATAVSAGLVTIAMGLFVNFPIALAPGMGLNAYFAVVASANGGQFSWQVALAAVFISGIIFVILTVTKIRQILVEAVPTGIKSGISVGIGLFITIIGLKLSHILVAEVHTSPDVIKTLTAQNGFVSSLHFWDWDLKFGSILAPDTLTALIGLAIISFLMAKKVKGSILYGIILTTLIGIPLKATNVANFHWALPDFSHLAVGALDLQGAMTTGIGTLILTFTFVELFDTFGTLIGTGKKAGLIDEHGNSPAIGKAMLVDALGISFGALMGTSTITSYVESAAGVGEGGRTGLTSVTTGVLFLLALVLAPIFIIIPDAATAPALITVGLLMMSGIKEIDFDDFTEALPAFLTIIMMPFTYSIANGVSAGIVFYTFLKVVTGKFKEIHWMMWILTALVIYRYIALAAG
ncbi:NCS2 family permease [Desulfitobacterium metallireducens]|uniref:Permease n=1 Tax=Desulfitobacterium metallireducens DSM 15288 TaxID=871968 RepID=W0EE05_9FIRM|nr:NCS2 family permease [Desulfitobacterium metallireducens]AHF07733.1 permease [Desulfitobacterium metallireducens DSM 15288]